MSNVDNGVFLHSCCGPCALYPLNALRQEGYGVTGFFNNPNIHPYREFRARLDSFRTMAERMELPIIVEEAYGLAPFLSALKDWGGGAYHGDGEARCAICYRMRLEKTAAACREAGFATFSTTLLVSPYQRHELIRKIGEETAAVYGLSFLYRDFRTGFRQGQDAARVMGLYMQGYCGCLFSEYERYGGKNEKK